MRLAGRNLAKLTASSDAFNDALHFPRFYHEKIVKEISRLGHHPLLDIAALCSDLNRIRVSLQGSSMPLPENLAECDDLLCRSQMLQTQEDPFIRATSCAVELVLRLSLRRYRPQENLTCMAGKLRDALESLSLRPCSYMDMTSLHLMIGALASDEGSTERAWFISKLRRAVLGLEARWENPLEILEEVFVPDDDLAGPLKALWHELRTSSHSVDQDRRRLLLSP